jgi:hypothetical protein
MAPTLDVQIRDLVTATRDLSWVANSFTGIKGYMADTHMSMGNWPLVAWGTAHAYKRAASTAEDAAAAVHGAGDSTAKNLDAVARHYADADYSSSIEPASSPDTYLPPNSGADTTSGNSARVLLTPTELLAGQLILLLRTARAQVKFAAGPAGVLPIVLSIDAVAIEPNIRDSGPFREVRDTWRTVAENIAGVRDVLEGHVPIQSWDGDAATSFNAHMRNRYLPALDELTSLAGSMGDLCDEMATGMDQINKSWLALLLETAIQLFILSLIPLPYRPLASIAVIGLFVGDATYLYMRMAEWFSEKAAAAADMEQQARKVAKDCFDDSQVLDDKRNLLNPRFTMVSAGWSSEDWNNNWHYKAAP